MKHHGYNLNEGLTLAMAQSIKEQQTEMIKRHYTDYTDDNWVLWIVPNLHHNFETKDLSGEIEIKKKDGGVFKVSTALRKPYPNKLIFQLSMVSGHRRLYGIPLVFKTFEGKRQTKAHLYTIKNP